MLRPLAVLLLCLVPGLALAQGGWVRHDDGEGRYSVEFPSPPIADLVKEPAPMDQTIDVYMQEWESGDGSIYLAVTWRQLGGQPADSLALPRQYAAALRAVIAANAGSELLSLEIVTVNGLTGQELVIDNPLSVNHIRQRQFIFRDRLVQQIYTGPRGSTDDDDVEYFFDSLRLAR